jgi:hypothetical protein
VNVIVPFTELHPATEKALLLYGPRNQVWYHNVSSSDQEYWNVLARQWATGEGFIIIEHDVEVRNNTIQELTDCPEDWCAFPYAMGPSGYQTALGCTKFSTDLVQRYTNLLQEAGDKHDPWSAKRDWRRLDRRIFETLTEHGESEHRHEPPVKHHNPEKRVPIELELPL